MYRARGDTDVEVAALCQAIVISPNRARPSRQLALALERAGDLEQARALLERSVAGGPLDAVTRGVLAETL